MADRDRRYYGYSEYERIQRSIAKKERWLAANPDKANGLRETVVRMLKAKLLVTSLT